MVIYLWVERVVTEYHPTPEPYDAENYSSDLLGSYQRPEHQHDDLLL
jgi:hypothetical protein